MIYTPKQSLINAKIIKITTLNDPILESQVDTWKYLTQKLIHHFTPSDVLEWVLQIMEGMSDLQFKAGFPLFIYDKGLIKEIKDKPQNYQGGSGITSKINEKISIIDIAKQYGVKVRGDKAICPFHNDTDPSMTFKNNRFKCWSSNCGKSGNIIDFIFELEKIGYKREDSNDQN